MKRLGFALIYTALAALAIPAQADVSSATALRAGDMKKLNFHSAPKPVSAVEFVTIDDEPLTLAEWQGKWVLVNFWATWCAPCRKEMPMLSELQAELGGETFEVVTIASGPNPKPALKRFFETAGVDNLPLHRDPRSALSRDMAVLGLPITVVIDPDGNEVGRLQGEADWSDENAKAVLRALIGASGG